MISIAVINVSDTLRTFLVDCIFIGVVSYPTLHLLHAAEATQQYYRLLLVFIWPCKKLSSRLGSSLAFHLKTAESGSAYCSFKTLKVFIFHAGFSFLESIQHFNGFIYCHTFRSSCVTEFISSLIEYFHTCVVFFFNQPMESDHG